jgi:DNA-binding response OmpR family regulator
MSEALKNQPTIFLVEADDETRPVLKSNLQRYGYRVIIALDEEDALDRANNGGIQADLILLDVVRMPPEDALSIGRRIRNNAKHNGRTPLVLMAEKFGPDVEGTDVEIADNEWITYLEDSCQLKNLLARLIRKMPTQDTIETREL